MPSLQYLNFIINLFFSYVYVQCDQHRKIYHTLFLEKEKLFVSSMSKNIFVFSLVNFLWFSLLFIFSFLPVLIYSILFYTHLVAKTNIFHNVLRYILCTCVSRFVEVCIVENSLNCLYIFSLAESLFAFLLNAF